MNTDNRDKWVSDVTRTVENELSEGDRLTHNVDSDNSVTFYITGAKPIEPFTFDWRDKTAEEAALQILQRYKFGWGA